MNASILASGELIRDPDYSQTKTTNRPMASILFACNMGGENKQIVSAMTLDEGSLHALEKAAMGDKVSVQGNLEIGIYAKDGTQKPSLRVIFSRVLTSRPPRREKQERPEPSDNPLAFYDAAGWQRKE